MGKLNSMSLLPNLILKCRFIEVLRLVEAVQEARWRARGLACYSTASMVTSKQLSQLLTPHGTSKGN